MDFDVDDMIMVSTKNWNTGRLGKKLDHHWTGPFRILAKEGNAFRIDLPDSIKVHPVINPEHLQRVSTSEPFLASMQTHHYQSLSMTKMNGKWKRSLPPI